MLLGIFEICAMIQRLNSYILLTDRVTKKASWTIYRLYKKSWESMGEIETFHKGQYLKPSNIDLAAVSVYVRKNCYMY